MILQRQIGQTSIQVVHEIHVDIWLQGKTNTDAFSLKQILQRTSTKTSLDEIQSINLLHNILSLFDLFVKLIFPKQLIFWQWLVDVDIGVLLVLDSNKDT